MPPEMIEKLVYVNPSREVFEKLATEEAKLAVVHLHSSSESKQLPQLDARNRVVADHLPHRFHHGSVVVLHRPRYHRM